MRMPHRHGATRATLVGMTETTSTHTRSGRSWRYVTPVIFLVTGGLFAVSAANSEGTDLRPGRTTDLASLVRVESEHLEQLRRESRSLTREVNALSRGLQDPDVRRAQRVAEQLRPAAGLTRVAGAGLTVTLSDAPKEVQESSDEDINSLVVHQQDIQAVVNAFFDAGAEAVTIQGQRIVSSTGIQCSGPTVQVNGLYFPQPYEISAIGDPDELEQRIDLDGYLQVYRAQALQPDIAIGWDLRRVPELVAPGYTGAVNPEYAEPLD